MNYKILLLFLIFNIVAYSNECIDKAFVKFQNKDYLSAISILKSCESNIINKDDSKLLTKYYYGLGRSYLELGNIDSAFKYELIAYNLKRSFNLDANLNLSLNDLGILYNKKGLPHKSIFLLNNAIRLNKSKSNNELLYSNYINIGVSYKDLGLIDSAENYYLKALKINIKDNSIKRSKIYNNIGVLYQEQGNYQKSKKYLKLALESKGIDEIMKYQYLTSMEITKFYNNELINEELFHIYLNKVINSPDYYFLADAQYKLSLINKTNFKKSKYHLIKSINLMIKNENYNGGLMLLYEYERHYLVMNEGIKISSYLDSLERKLLSLNTARIAKEYGNELKINQESEIQISNLKSELKYSNIRFYGLLTFLILVVISVFLIILWIKKNRIIQKLILRVISYNSYNKALSKDTKSNLGKLTYLLDYKLDSNNNKLIFKILDNIIQDVNKIESYNFSNNIKEVECQILQHQQITNGSEIH